ncbi:MAG TPA: acyl-ACP--UDP-N-acetylglucosamine O-acyltransferase [Planctomycetota bacterium]|nr:acyl-ACP--UDP-N-acetylglucosamine O-acyltransferase [Planctomycetota bacterium]
MIHATAIIDPKAKLGTGVSVGPYSVVGPDVTVGDGCTIHNHVTLTGFTTIGKNVQIFPGAVVGGAPQDLKYKGEKTKLIIGDGTMIRECCTLHVGTELGGGETVVGSNNLIMAYVHVAHDCRLRNNIVIANGAQLAGHVHVHDGARISGLAAIHHFVTIGACAFVAGCAKLSVDVPPFTLAEGHPARIRALNKEGLKRRGLSTDAQEAMKEAFRLCFREHLPQEHAFKELTEKGHDRFIEVAMLIEFLKATAKGKHGRALEAEREIVPAEERDGRLNFKIKPEDPGSSE